jgi:DNA-binding PadR family transcriptional regulator
LYEVIHRLVEGGQIAEVDAPTDEPASGGPPRRFYALSQAGRVELRSELERMDDVVRYARGIELLGG